MNAEWTPSLRSGATPLYRAIADALSEAIDRGELRAGARLPTHRDLAGRLAVTVGTVSRAYAEAERRGLTRGEVGRGTFVLPSVTGAASTVGGAAVGPEPSAVVDLSQSLLAWSAASPELGEIRRGLAELAADASLPELLGAQSPLGSIEHRARAEQLLVDLGLRVDGTEAVITDGGQNAMAAVLAATCRAGDIVLTEELTFPGIKAVASYQGLRLRPVAIDREGLLPDALAVACRAERARVLYTIPTLHNPTSAVLGRRRRRAVADIARRHDLVVLEDAVYSPLAEDPPPPIGRSAPERSFLFTSFSKLLAPGLRVGLLQTPSAWASRLRSALWATQGLGAGLLAELALRWAENGVMAAVIGRLRVEASERFQLAREVMAPHRLAGHPCSYHVWLELPEPWSGHRFASAAREVGVLVSPSDLFSVSRTQSHAVRVSLLGVGGTSELENALRSLRLLIDQPAAVSRWVV